MVERFAQLDVRIEAEPDADREELVALAVRLREWLLPVGVESVGFVAAGPAPSGTRSAGMFVADMLTVLFARFSELLVKLIDVVQSWLSSSGARSVRLELDGDVLEVTGITRGDQRELIRTWIDRHTDG
ncbi:MAG: hypothetical protein M3460_22570 [Actinomycetota bacterium]|nr:hypothetical protein [Actinomycetota bacterium]